MGHCKHPFHEGNLSVEQSSAQFASKQDSWWQDDECTSSMHQWKILLKSHIK